MASVNKVHLLGNLTREPEMRYTPKGTAVCQIGLALNRKRKDQDGQTVEEVTFVDVTLWGRTAEIAEQYLSKGRPVYIEGRLQLDTWEDKGTGEKRSRLKVIGENLQLLPAGGAPERKARAVAPNQSAPPDPGDHVGNNPDHDDIPF